MGRAENNDGVTGDEKLGALKNAGWPFSEKYEGKKYEDVPGLDQLAIDEAFEGLAIKPPVSVSGAGEDGADNRATPPTGDENVPGNGEADDFDPESQT
jgi:hypothetical protein